MELFISLHQKLTDSTQQFEVSQETRDCHKRNARYQKVGKLGYMEGGENFALLIFSVCKSSQTLPSNEAWLEVGHASTR